MKLLNLELALSVLLCFIMVLMLTTGVAIAQPIAQPCLPTTPDPICDCPDIECNEPVFKSNSCGYTCDCVGTDYYICGKCGRTSSDECNDLDVRFATIVDSNAETCCVNCEYGNWEESAVHCAACKGALHAINGEPGGLGDYKGPVSVDPMTLEPIVDPITLEPVHDSPLGAAGCCGDDDGESVQGVLRACSPLGGLFIASELTNDHIIVSSPTYPNTGFHGTIFDIPGINLPPDQIDPDRLSLFTDPIYFCEEPHPDAVNQDVLYCHETTLTTLFASTLLSGQNDNRDILCHTNILADMSKWPEDTRPINVCCEDDPEGHAVYRGICFPPDGPSPVVVNPLPARLDCSDDNYALVHPVECGSPARVDCSDDDYALIHPRECGCSDDDYALANPVECASPVEFVGCSDDDYALAHPVECASPVEFVGCSDDDYALVHPGECGSPARRGCSDDDYALVHPGECGSPVELDCSDDDYVLAHPGECGSPVAGNPGSYAIDGFWHDCDDSINICGLCGLEWLPGGEYDTPSDPLASNLGEYDYHSGLVSWPFECCGDDANEFIQSRRTGCLGGTNHCDRLEYPDNWPEFDADPNDIICCSDYDDAAYKGRCFEDKKDPADPADVVGGPYNFDGLRITVADATNVPNLVANKRVWYDCDSDEATCTGHIADGLCGFNWTKTGEYIMCGEYLPLPGTPRGPYGGGPAAPLTDASILKECCGDDLGEIYVSTFQGITDTFAACCNSANDCVDYDGDCVTHCQFSQKDDFPIGKPLHFSDYQCILGDWWPKISGTVKNVYNQPIRGAEVRVVGAYFRGGHVGTWNTDSAGEYYIYVPNGTYDVIASKIAGSNIFYGYEDTVFFSVDIQEPVQVDFVLRNRSTDCTAACTRSDGLCHASCDGLSGCSNFIAACDLAAPGIIRTGAGGTGQSFNCCNNATVPSRLPADVSVCGDNVVKFVRPVVLRGQLVNMVLVVFEESSNC